MSPSTCQYARFCAWRERLVNGVLFGLRSGIVESHFSNSVEFGTAQSWLQTPVFHFGGVFGLWDFFLNQFPLPLNTIAHRNAKIPTDTFGQPQNAVAF